MPLGEVALGVQCKIDQLVPGKLAAFVPSALAARWAFTRSAFYVSGLDAANARVPVLVGVKKMGQHKHTGATLHWQLAQHAPVRMHVTRSLWVWAVRFDAATS